MQLHKTLRRSAQVAWFQQFFLLLHSVINYGRGRNKRCHLTSYLFPHYLVKFNTAIWQSYPGDGVENIFPRYALYKFTFYLLISYAYAGVVLCATYSCYREERLNEVIIGLIGQSDDEVHTSGARVTQCPTGTAQHRGTEWYSDLRPKSEDLILNTSTQ